MLLTKEEEQIIIDARAGKRVKTEVNLPDGWDDIDEEEYQKASQRYNNEFFFGSRVSIGNGYSEPAIAAQLPPVRRQHGQKY